MPDRVGSAEVGSRVVVRRAVGDGKYVDVLGHLVGLGDEGLEVVTGRGERVVVPVAEVAAAKPVPAKPVPTGWEVPELSADDLQRICSAGWPAAEAEPLGDWLLRAHDGLTGRANSVMAVGDPGVPFDEAIARATEWYAARDLPVLMQQPQGGPADVALQERGWPMLHVTIVQVAPLQPVLHRLRVRDDVRSAIDPLPSPQWQALMHDLDPHRPQRHLEILTGTPKVGFATVLDGVEPVGIGRVSIEGEWAGVTSVDVAPSARRRGIGTEVMRAMLGWAADQGATSTYLQVRARNAEALALYARLGYRTHHPYCYRVPPA
jgi:GNAT superfamily N-acetyltransferase